MKTNLERLISQSVPFTSPYVMAQVGLLYLSYMQIGLQQDFFKKYGLTSQQYNALRILRGQYPSVCNINLIRNRMLDKKSDASRIVDRLVKSGFVNKHENSLDRRNVDVIITEKALDLLMEIDKHIDSLPLHIRLLSEKQVQEFNELIEVMLASSLPSDPK